MKYSEINFRKAKKGEIIKLYIAENLTSPSTSEKKELHKLIQSGAKEGNHLVALNAIIFGILFDSQKTFETIRRRGLFRYSNYIKERCIVGQLAADTLEAANLIGYQNEVDLNYLKSVITLSPFHDLFKEIRFSILKEIKFFKKMYPSRSLVKTLLAYVEHIFLVDHKPLSIHDLSRIECRNKEDISDAVSYLIHFISEGRSLKAKEDTLFVAEDYIGKRSIDRIIILACHHNNLKEIEILIEHFNYTSQRAGRTISILPPSEGFSKSMRLGFIRDAIQLTNDLRFDKEAESMKELVEKINSIEHFDIFKLTNSNGYLRYRIEFPITVLEALINRFFKPDHLFREEITYLSRTFKEQYLNMDDVNRIKIIGDLTIMDFIKIKRIFYFFQLLFSEQIYLREQQESPLLFRSIIPVFTEDQFYEWLSKLMPTEKIDDFLDVVCWEEGFENVFDLQYHSILFIDGLFMIPLTVFTESNTIRNLYASENKKKENKLVTDGVTDPITDDLSNSLSNKKIKNFKQVNYSRGEIDVVAIQGDTLIIFECKQSLHPTSMFELRTVYDYIQKAQQQLDKVNETFSAGELLPELEVRLKHPLGNIKNIMSCIVLSNRMFCGNAFKYPIRNIHELCNFIDTGRVTTADGDFCLWEGSSLTLSDLIDYLGKSNKLFQVLYGALEKEILRYSISDFILEEETYYWEQEQIQNDLSVFTSGLRKLE